MVAGAGAGAGAGEEGGEMVEEVVGVEHGGEVEARGKEDNENKM